MARAFPGVGVAGVRVLCAVALGLGLLAFLPGPAHGASLLAPEEGLGVPPNPRLEWVVEQNEYSVSVAVFGDRANPAGSVVWERRLQSTDSGVTVSDDLALGRYYWRLIARDETRPCEDSLTNCRQSETRSFVVERPRLEELSVKVKKHRNSRGSTRFTIELAQYADSKLVVIRQGKTTLRVTVPGGPRDQLSRDYRWTCSRAGLHSWKVEASDIYGTKRTRRGRFRVPRCYVLRATAIAHAVAFKSPQFVSHVSCRSAGTVRGGRSNAWHCRIIWNDTRRQCTGTYLIRRTLDFHGNFSPWREELDSAPSCQEFFERGIESPVAGTGAQSEAEGSDAGGMSAPSPASSTEAGGLRPPS